MKKLILILALAIPIICQAQYINQNPHSDCIFKEGDIVLVPFDQVVSLWIIGSENRIQDSINTRNQLMLEFDTVDVKAKIIQGFFIQEYGICYYYISVYDKKDKIRDLPIFQTSKTSGRFSAISERYLRKRPLTI